jgi:beta-lactamase superfamily II metal-dependent hydrolase
VRHELSAAITIEVLDAAYGDAIWIECARDGRPWRMVVDGGPPEAAGALAARVDALPPGDRRIDVVVVSHIDSDHIGGMLPLLERDDVDIGDVWFNALPQLPEADERRTRSVAEGEDLVHLLTGITRSQPLPWNLVVDGGPVATTGDRTFRELELADGPRITLLSPTPKRLLALRRMWVQALTRLRRGEPEETEAPAPLEPLGDLHALAGSVTVNDTSVPNGSSIAFLLEHRGASCLLGADAFPTVLGGALWALANARDGRPVAVDAVKLPHHGSQKNVGSKLLTLVSSKHFLVSTNGERFGHPNDVSLARAVTAGGSGTTLWFNYPPTAKTQRWAEPDLGAAYAFTTRFADAGGTRLELPGRP